MVRINRYTPALYVLATIVAFPQLAAAEIEREPAVSGIRVEIDNDLFAGGDRDRDYTGGFAFSFSGGDARDRYLSLDPVLAAIDAITSPGLAQSAQHVRQIGLMVFTPNDVLSTAPVVDDRPYASLLFTTNARLRVAPDRKHAWTSTFTVGVLGLSLTERLHGAVHELVGSERPRGYAHQISAGGEPTARYTLAHHRLLHANSAGNLDVKATFGGSVGYLTEASAAVTMRVGSLDTPWWSVAPELTDYAAAPMPVARHSRPERYVFAGVQLKARAYNAFLQGQFRHSPVRYSFDEIEPLILEAWIGLVTQVLANTQVSYTLNYQTAELRTGVADRDALWGAVQLSHSF